VAEADSPPGPAPTLTVRVRRVSMGVTSRQPVTWGASPV
jgi:hypothetical protein